MALPPLAGTRWLTSWVLDLPVVLAVAFATVGYLVLRARVPGWARARTLSFLGAMAGVLFVKSGFLAVYDHSLFWVLAVQDVILLALLPAAVVLGHPVQLARTAFGRLGGRGSAVLAPILGSLAAMATLLAVYSTGWDLARLQHRWLFTVTHLVLLLVGCAFLGPLLSERGTGYGARTLVALFDGLLDAIPGLAVLGTQATIAHAWYSAHPRSWGPTHARDQLIGGAAMIALSELVGLPTLIVLLVRWARADAADALAVDARLDVVAAHSSDQGDPEVTKPWWETDAGPLADRAAREGWSQG